VSYLSGTYNGPSFSAYTTFVAANFGAQFTGNVFREAADRNRFLIAGSLLQVRNGGVSSTLSYDTEGSSSLAVTNAVAEKPTFYSDGVSVGVGTLAVTPGFVNGDTWRLFGVGASGWQRPTWMYVMYPGVLSPTEISLLHTYSQGLVTPRKQWPGGGLTTGNPKYVDNIQTARVTLVNETSGNLSNTEISIQSGTWALTETAAGRAITCVANGQLKKHLVGADTFTTKLFTQTGGVVLTKNAADFTLDATAGDTITALQLTAP
jgi:hypothetical protein